MRIILAKLWIIVFLITITPRFFPVHRLTIGLEVRLVGLDDGATDVAGGGHGGVLDGGVVARGHLEVLALKPAESNVIL